jgi:hypothetical protein
VGSNSIIHDNFDFGYVWPLEPSQKVLLAHRVTFFSRVRLSRVLVLECTVHEDDEVGKRDASDRCWKPQPKRVMESVCTCFYSNATSRTHFDAAQPSTSRRVCVVSPS